MRYGNPHSNQHPINQNQQGMNPQMGNPNYPQGNPQYPQYPNQPMPPQYPNRQFNNPPMQPQYPNYPPQMPPQFPNQYPNQPIPPQYPNQYPPQQFPPQYPNQYPQQIPNQPFPPQYQQNNRSVVNGGRFTSQEQPQQFNQYGNPAVNRYVNPQTQDIDSDSTKAIPFNVKITSSKFRDNEKIKLNTITSEVNTNHIKLVEGVLASACLQENIESLIESAYDVSETETLKPITIRNFITNHSFYRIDINDTINDILKDDVKYLYKASKMAYKEISSVYGICVLEKLDDILTERVNDYIAITSNNSISIDSFISDFNDLLKIIRTEEEDLAEKLIEYLDSFIKDININLNSVDKPTGYTVLTEPVTIVYLDKHILETGLENIGETFVKLERTPSNTFLNSLLNSSYSATAKQEFLLVTIDKTVFKCYVDEDNNAYIRLYTY
jgi:hypothetical protein